MSDDSDLTAFDASSSGKVSSRALSSPHDAELSEINGPRAVTQHAEKLGEVVGECFQTGLIHNDLPFIVQLGDASMGSVKVEVSRIRITIFEPSNSGPVPRHGSLQRAKAHKLLLELRCIKSSRG